MAGKAHILFGKPRPIDGERHSNDQEVKQGQGQNGRALAQIHLPRIILGMILLFSSP